MVHIERAIKTLKKANGSNPTPVKKNPRTFRATGILSINLNAFGTNTWRTVFGFLYEADCTKLALVVSMVLSKSSWLRALLKNQLS